MKVCFCLVGLVSVSNLMSSSYIRASTRGIREMPLETSLSVVAKSINLFALAIPKIGRLSLTTERYVIFNISKTISRLEYKKNQSVIP